MLIHSRRLEPLYRAFTSFWWLENRWRWPYLLLPFTWFYSALVILRRLMFHGGIFRIHRFPVPVIVVGNIAVGGTGKTPLVMYLAHWLQQHGYHPGIVSRGYGARCIKRPLEVTNEDSVSSVGDEAVLMRRNISCPLVISPDRVQAVRYLLQHHPECNVVISDDGLQHYAMGRDIEIVVIDGERRFGNGFCLPVGPLREPVCRIKKAHFVFCNGGTPKEPELRMQLLPGHIVSLTDENKVAERSSFSRATVHAVAAIGNPQRFFQTLRRLGLRFFEHAFPDHYPLALKDIDFGENTMTVMTEKDAVKCFPFSNQRHWFLKVTAQVDERFEESFLRVWQQKQGRL